MDQSSMFRAFLARSLGYSLPLKGLGLPDPGLILVSGSLEIAPADVWGMNKFAVQVEGLITSGGGIQMKSTISGTYVNLDAQINSNGIVQLTGGLYGKIRAVPVGGAGNTTLAADAHAGDTEVTVAAVAGLPATGWITLDAVGAAMPIRYTALDAGVPKKLTGIPATGAGSITATVVSGKTVTLGVGDTTKVTLYGLYVP